MKQNGNDKNVLQYYLSFDIGTDSVGWAATDLQYNLLRKRGKDLWGIRLFDEGQTQQTRRLARTNRRRLARRKWRIALLRELFEEEITALDDSFFMRIKESGLIGKDKTVNAKFTLFNDSDYSDKNYYIDDVTKTAYHLRRELITNKQPHDIRLVFLAIHHIIKSRGHFLYSLSDDGEPKSFDRTLQDYVDIIKERLGISIHIESSAQILDVLRNEKFGKKEKQEKLRSLFVLDSEGEEYDQKSARKAVEILGNIIVGSSVSLKQLFPYSELSDQKFSVTDAEDKLQESYDLLGDDADILIFGKAVYDSVIYEKITRGHSFLSEYKVEQYERHKTDIATLKEYVRNVLCDKALYKEIFVDEFILKTDEKGREKREGLNNYVAYSRYKKGDRYCSKPVSQEDFCKYLLKKLGDIADNADAKYIKMLERIRENRFAPKLRTNENGAIPNSLHRKELCAILDNASAYLPFLNEQDDSGISVRDKILAIFDYKLPYYFGPLGKFATEFGWAKRNEDMENAQILPWNFKAIIDEQATAKEFIERMKSVCTYTGEDVLSKDSLLYSEFTVLNEINNIKINGNSLQDNSVKMLIFNRLFKEKNRKVRRTDIEKLLLQEGKMQKGDIVSGVDDCLNSNYSSYHKMKNIISKTSYDTAEEIIRHIVLFGDDKTILRNWINQSVPTLDENDVKYLLSLKFKGWGALSKKFLTGIYDIDRENGTGELLSIMDVLRNTNLNLMKLLSDKYEYAKKAAEHKANKLGIRNNPRQMVDELYVSPKIRRAIWQTIRIADEIVDTMNGAPKKIFIEVARENTEEDKKKRTKSRKEQLAELYKQCEKQSKELYNYISKEEFDDLKKKLENEKDGRLNAKKLYLYYKQFGRCMYSGKPIDLERLINDRSQYDCDHIFPRSKIKDDSFDNLVLVDYQINRDKTDIYPISGEVREKMYPFWKMLLDNDCISREKFTRLIRAKELSEDELSAFVNRQLVETRQSTKAVAQILSVLYGGDANRNGSKIVYSKAGNVSDFRKQFDMLKCRAVNDLHHAKDAYLNIVVGNFFDTKFTADFMRHIKENERNYTLNPDKMYNHDVKGAWEKGEGGTIATVRKVMSKNNVLFTRMPVEVKGALFDLQPLKKSSGLIPIKQDKNAEEYGGYDNAKGAFLALVEYEDTSKKVAKTYRCLEYVLVCRKAEYEQNPQAFAEKYWSGNNIKARVIIRKILTKSLLELDGQRFHVTGRTGDRLILIHTNQLILGYDAENKIRLISKLVEKCKNAKYQVYDENNECLSAYFDKNIPIELYNLLLEKLTKPAYNSILSSFLIKMQNCRQKFCSSDYMTQCRIILECLKAFACKAVYPELKDIGGSKTGAITKSKNITNCKSAYLINQSVTGLYEYKVDLKHFCYSKFAFVSYK